MLREGIGQWGEWAGDRSLENATIGLGLVVQKQGGMQWLGWR